MIETWTLRVPPALVAELSARIEGLRFDVPGTDVSFNLDKAQARQIAALAAETLAPRMRLNWGDDKYSAPPT